MLRSAWSASGQVPDASSQANREADGRARGRPCASDAPCEVKVFFLRTHVLFRTGMRPMTLLAQTRSEPPTLRVVGGGAKGAGAERTGQPGAAPTGADASRDTQFREIYERWFDDVVGWLYAPRRTRCGHRGSRPGNLHRRSPKSGRFDGGNLAGWLYRIAQLTVRDHRRRSWFRNLVLRRQEVDLNKMPHEADSPAQISRTPRRAGSSSSWSPRCTGSW